MEEPPNRFKPPLSLVMLDVIGTTCLGIGLAKMYAGIDFLPDSLQFDAKGWTFIIIGVLLMLPMLLHLVAKIREQAEKKLIK
jgi:hypothetical protein